MKFRPYDLPDDLLMGSATASLQIEGGDRNNTWYRWAEAGKVLDGTHCIVAADHWNRVDEDVALMKSMNHQVYRMGIEWSRIEPKKGFFDESAIQHYRDEILKLKDAGIEPLVTLHHFSNPLWMEDLGGWSNPSAPIWFQDYTARLMHSLGDLVSDWVTINEPNVYLANGYVFGIWPPGEKNIKSYFKCAKHMIQAHLLAYKKLHDGRRLMGYQDTKVGCAFHMRIYDPKTKSPFDKLACGNLEYLFQQIFITGFTEGKYLFPVGWGGSPLGKGIYSDFIGVNYYTRDIVSFKFDLASGFSERECKELSEKNGLGWEIYPQGLYRICKKLYKKYQIPIYITENGTCDSKDDFRAKYIYDHLYQIKLLREEGILVERYYHWSTLDNFEWIEGLSARFGLVKVNYDNQKRTIRKSGKFYGEICKQKAVSEKMIEKYL